MLGNSRKISVSFVSEALPSTSNGPSYGPRRINPLLKNLLQTVLRLQVMQIVLGLTLMILSAMAIIEERVILGLGFSLISAIIIICCSVIGTQQTNPKVLFVINLVALCGLIPSLNYVLISLHRNILLKIDTYQRDGSSGSPTFVDVTNTTTNLEIGSAHDQNRTDFPTTSWILGWAILGHLITMFTSLLYTSYLLKDIHFYRLAATH